MPPRRSARAASALPALSTEKPKSRVAVGKKRAASHALDVAPPTKKVRKKQEVENAAPLGRPLLVKPLKGRRRDDQVAVQSLPYLNPLPSLPDNTRPPLVLFVWGSGNFGQFGMGPDVLCEIDKPKRNAWMEQNIPQNTFGEDGAGLAAVAGGGLHSLLLDEKGAIWTCGVNDDAALGRITQDVPDPSNPGTSLDIDELTSFPHPLSSLYDSNFRAVHIAAGDSICAAVSSTGSLRVWGSFRSVEGLLGFSEGLKHQFEPVEPYLSLFHKPGDTERVSSVAAGSNHILVLTTHGRVYTWGAGEMGQLGRKVLERRKIHGTVPEKITLGDRQLRAVAVGAGSYSSYAVDVNGEVWGWGLNSNGQLGMDVMEDTHNVPLPTRIDGLSPEALGGDKVLQIVGGEHHALFLTSSGKVFACGRSGMGQLGLPDDHPAFKEDDSPNYITTPTQIRFPGDDDPVEPDTIVEVSAGVHNNMAVSKQGALFCWGQGIQGELGVSDEVVKTPRMIVRREGGAWAAVHVSCGGQHTLGLFRRRAVE